MTHRNRTPMIVAALLLLGLASDVLGGIWSQALNGALTGAVIAGALALPVLLLALTIGVLGHRGPRRTR